MSNPQQPELARSRKTPAQDQDSVAAVVEGQRAVGADAPRGPVPPENQPGHHPPVEQDKPDLNAFAERLGLAEAPAQEAEAPVGSAAPLRQRRAGWLAPLGAVVVALVVGILLKRRRGRTRRRKLLPGLAG